MQSTLRILSVLLCALFGLNQAEARAKKPNIILVITDDQGYGPVGRHGHPWIRTPHLDKLYDTSTRFTRFLVSPTCAPTRSAIMTGRHPMKNGVTHTILERERMTLKATILPQVLKQAGYTSGILANGISAMKSRTSRTRAGLMRRSSTARAASGRRTIAVVPMRRATSILIPSFVTTARL